MQSKHHFISLELELNFADFDAMSQIPHEVLTGALTRQGHRDLQHWTDYNQRKGGGSQSVEEPEDFASRASRAMTIKKKSNASFQIRFPRVDRHHNQIVSDTDRSRERIVFSRDHELKEISGIRPRPGIVAYESVFESEKHGKKSKTKEPSIKLPVITSATATEDVESISVAQQDSTSVSEQSLDDATCSASVDEKYFGLNARTKFFAAYHEIGRRRNILVGGDDELDAMISQPDCDVLAFTSRSLNSLSSKTRPSSKGYQPSAWGGSVRGSSRASSRQSSGGTSRGYLRLPSREASLGSRPVSRANASSSSLRASVPSLSQPIRPLTRALAPALGRTLDKIQTGIYVSAFPEGDDEISQISVSSSLGPGDNVFDSDHLELHDTFSIQDFQSQSTCQHSIASPRASFIAGNLAQSRLWNYQ